MTTSAGQSLRRIRPLPDRLINKIAAGEVVERPSAVVKELIENALDAGATRISLEVEKAGIGLIRIVDNGCGIPDEQIEIAFSRHATSKISSLDDLERITSYGFRGEALPSIASVSRVRMVSKPADQPAATELVIEGGIVMEKRPSGGGNGTTIEVRDLFFNTPARRKFLKSEATESRQISRLMTALALSRIDVSFAYVANGREVFSLPPAESLASRAAELLAEQRLLTGSFRGETISLQFAVGRADAAHRDRLGQFFFINGRWIQSPALSHAFGHAYGELLPRGNFPIGVIQMTIDPPLVDVNVHPAKTEVRLANESAVRDTLYRALKAAVHEAGSIQDLSLIRHAEPLAGRGGESAHLPAGRIPGIVASRLSPVDFSNLFDTATPRIDERTGEILAEQAEADVADGIPASNAAGEMAGEQLSITGAGIHFVGQFDRCYLLFQRGHDLLIIDQHTAHERVLFEDTLARMDRSGLASQRLLLPEQTELTPERMAIYQSSAEMLTSSGFEVSSFGGRTVLLQAVPALMTRFSPARALLQVLDDIDTLRKSGYELLKSVAQSVACRSAIMRGDLVTPAQAEGLVQQLLACSEPYSCPHGRPTFIKLDPLELDRRFGRR